MGIYGYYEWRILAIAGSVCSPGDTIVEVGANVGTETLGFSDILGDSGVVHAFEPLPTNFAALKLTLELNNITNVILYPLVVGSEEKKLLFSVPADEQSSGSGHIVLNQPLKINRDQIEVNCTQLDSLLQEIQDVKLMAIDAEGSEVMILQGASELIQRDKPAIILEASQKLLARFDFSLSDLASYLTQNKYMIFRINRLGLKKNDKEIAGSKSNWLCLHESKSGQLDNIKRYIRSCGLAPRIFGLNPLEKI